jgi:hypothetical protein
MTITVYPDVVLDECIFLAGGAAGTSTRQNDRTSNQGGFVTANAIRDVTLRTWALGVKPMPVPDWMEIEGVYEITDGGAFGFLILDPKDQFIDFSNGGMLGQMLGVDNGVAGFGNGTPNYVICKIYRARSSTRSKARALTRFVDTPTLERAGVPVVYGTGAGQVSIAAGPQVITFVADASANITGMTLGTSTVVALASALSGLVVGGRLWLEGVTGTDAAFFNQQSFTITAITGSTYTLALNSTGKSISVTGTGKKYPQPNEALVAAAQFYVPVQFAADDLDWDFIRPDEDVDNRLIAAQSVSLVEIREI